MATLRQPLQQCGELPPAALVQAAEQAVRDLAEASGAKLGQVAQPLRAALTGRATSPGIFDVLVLLGRDESLGRIADQMTGKENGHGG